MNARAAEYESIEPREFSIDSPEAVARRRFWAAVIWLIAITFVAYLPAMLWGGYIWDDDQYVVQNKTLRSLDGLQAIWTQPQSIPQYYPLVHTTYWIEYHLWGLTPLGYHAVNILLHAFNAILFWLVLIRLKVPGAAVAAFIFALHPVEVESVAWVTERKNTLSCLFYLSSMYVLLPLFGLRGRDDDAPPADKTTAADIARFAFGLLLFLCALGSKTVTASLPAALLVIIWWKHGWIRFRDIGWTAPMFVVGVLAGLYTAYLEREQVGAVGAEFSQTFIERCLIASRALWFYAGKLAWPTDLIFIYRRWDVDASIWWWWLFPAGVIAVVAALWLLRHRIGRGPLAAVLLFAGTLFPALSFLNVYPHRFSFVADHFQYHASLALIALAAAAGATLVRRLDGSAVRWAAGGAVVALLAIYAFATFQQSKIYQNKETLWRDVIAKNDQAFIAYTNLATLLLRDVRNQPRSPEGEFVPRMQEAFDLLHRGLELYPDAVSYHNLGEAYLMVGEREQAIPLLEKSVQLEPEMLPHRLTLARAYREVHRYDDAAEEFMAVAEMKPGYFAAWNNLARMYLTAEDENFRNPQRAIEVAQRAVDIQPKAPILHATLAAAYEAAGQYERAVEAAEEAVALATLGGPRFESARQAYQRDLDRYRQLAGQPSAKQPSTAPLDVPE